MTPACAASLMVRDPDVFVTSGQPRLRHGSHTPRTVTPFRMHLQIASHLYPPTGIPLQDLLRLRLCQKTTAYLLRLGILGGSCSPPKMTFSMYGPTPLSLG